MAAVEKRAAHIPVLRSQDASVEPSLDPSVYARTTCYKAGHLVTKNAGWRNIRPILDEESCTNCLQCYMYCPDGTIYKVRDEMGGVLKLAIDYDFCKGCGICARICKFGSISMVLEAEALAAERVEAEAELAGGVTEAGYIEIDSNTAEGEVSE